MARVDRCFTSTRPTQDFAMDSHYFYKLPHNNYLRRNEPLDHDSIQYTKIRTRNSNFNPAFYGRPMNKIVRKDLDPDWDVKQDCHNPYPSMSREEVMNNVPLVRAGRNGTHLTDPKSIMRGMQNTDKRLNKLTPNQYLSSKAPMKQPSGVVT